MKKTIFILAISLFVCNAWSQAGYINTYAGNGIPAYGGDSGPATSAYLDYPDALAFDASGNLYISDNNNDAIRKVNSSGIITTFAGNGVQGFSGDGGQATAAEFYYPGRVVFNSAGVMYVADQKNNRIRKITTSGIVTTMAGNGYAGYSGDGGPATAAELNSPACLTIDAAGNLYVSDIMNNAVRKITTSGTIKAFAGNGISAYSGDGGPASSAELKFPIGVNIDTHGNIFIADAYNERVRKVSTSGTITTYAGNGQQGWSGDGGPATAAEFYSPVDSYIDAIGIMYIADADNSLVRKITSSGIVSTIAGNGTKNYGGDGGPAASAIFNTPTSIAINSAGDIFIADQKNNRVRKINALTGVLEIEDNKSISIYPNPANSIINFTCSEDFKKAQIEIIDVSGRILLSENREIRKDVNNSFNITNVANGVYFVKVSSENSSWLGKFMKQ